ncbi:DKNYY family protein [Flavobacterium sp. 90]|uniref:DKNYY domain-containing protein n=1 Tax=unclassified Flavobacterium TaxID=196869 RepID=UPI000EB4D8CE|nr:MULTISPECIES: DKNYY domain-containing protein [unclassified Flavobacterium]RKR05707.1 DKNYY family protein [Flavobacterium sp. 81]TCK57019.1 DKNYY family protein [Flavobacterium sp. 90]
MNKYYFLVLSIILLSNLSCAQTPDSFSVIDPIVDTAFAIYPSAGYSAPLYIKNNNYVIFQKNASERKILKDADVESFRSPRFNEYGLFALDKNGVYYNGDFIATDTTGFKILAEIRNTEYLARPDLVWKTKYKLFKNNIEITEDIDIESFRSASNFSTLYFKDKNHLYYNFKKIKNADVNSLSETFEAIIYDKNYVYINGEIGLHNGDTLRSVNDYLMKTSKEVLTLTGRMLVPNIDAKTIRPLSRHYSIDKNFVYYDGEKTILTAKNPEKIKAWDQENSRFISDGKMIYAGTNYPFPEVDAKTFGMIPFSDWYFDKNGIYRREWNEKEGKSEFKKFPFVYTHKVTSKNTFLGQSYRYLIYENQAYDLSKKKMYKNLSQTQINAAKNAKTDIFNSTGKKLYEYQLYESDNKIYINSKETTADAETFERILNCYKDKNNVYTYYRSDKLIPIKGIDAQSVKPFFNFLADKDYIYSGANKVIKNKNVEILAVITGNRPGCGLDTTPSSDYYLLKNDDGYWLALISNVVNIKYLGNKPIEGTGNIGTLYTPPAIIAPGTIDENKIYNTVDLDVLPDYNGGMAARNKFVEKNFKAPKDEGERIQGKIYLYFIIEKDGTITNQKVLRDYGYGSGAEALRVLNKMPKWIPGQIKGKTVRSAYSTVFVIQK